MSVSLAERAARRDFGPDVLEWIAGGMRSLEAGESLERALKIDRASRIREHNTAMLEAARLIREQFPLLSLWKAAGKLAEMINYFERRTMPMLAIDPGHHLSAIEIEIRRALATKHRGPRTQRKLFSLLN